MSCREGETGCRGVEETVTHPEATASGSVSCAVAGSGGWCRGGAELSLSGSEPLAGYTILALEGTRNGETFACPGSSCSVPLLEGINDFTFWALSSWGDSSRMGTASGRLDSGPPVISGEVTGTAGEAGWYVSEVTVTASAGDAVSGLATFDLALDGGGWAPYSGPVTLSDGEHTVELRASDAAGNVATESLEVRVDTQPPELNLAVGGSFCPGCGESAHITLDVQDVGSGAAAWALSADGIGIASGNGPASETFAWDGSGLGAGTHTLTLSAHDAAGNAAETSVAVQLVAPTAVPRTEQSPNPAPQGVVVPSAPTATSAPIPTRTPVPTRTPSTSSFGALPAVSLSGEEGLPDEPEAGPETASAASAQGSSSGVLWGGAAATLIGAATAAALEAARRRKEEEARLRAEMARRNAEAEAREKAVLAALAAAKARAVLGGEQEQDQPTDGEAASAGALAVAAGLAAVVGAAAAAGKAIQRACEDRSKEPKEELSGAEYTPGSSTGQAGTATQSDEDERGVSRPPLGDRLRAMAEARNEPAPSHPVPIVTPTPTPPVYTAPTATPSAEEMLAAERRAHERWLESLSSEIQECMENLDDRACILQAGAMIYTHYEWDLAELARSGTDNPLQPDSDEVRLMAHPIVTNASNTASVMFLKELGLSWDHWSNYEPAFLEFLRSENREGYQVALDVAAADEDTRAAIEKKVLDSIVDGIADALSEGYFRPGE